MLTVTALFCFIITEEPLWQLAILILSVIIHEGAHVLALKFCRNNFSINTEALGIRISAGRLNYLQEAIVLSSGPCANIAVAIVLSLIFKKSGNDCILLALYSNAALGVFNLLPVSTFDGGNLLKLTLEYLCAPHVAFVTARILSVLTLTFIWLIGIYAILISNTGAYLVFVSLWLISAQK